MGFSNKKMSKFKPSVNARLCPSMLDRSVIKRSILFDVRFCLIDQILVWVWSCSITEPNQIVDVRLCSTTELSISYAGRYSQWPNSVNLLWFVLVALAWILTKPCFFAAAYEDNLDDVHSYWKEYFMVFHIVPKKVCNFYLLLSKVDDFSDTLTRVIKSSKQPICFTFFLEPVSIITSQALLVYRSLLSKITRDLTRPFFLAGFLSSLARHTKRNRDYS